MKNQMVIVVLDHANIHHRKWPSRLEGIAIERKSVNDGLTKDDNILLYAFHVRDFLSFPAKKKGIFSDEEKLWPKNVLWYSGGDIEKKYPGHVYKEIVPHEIGIRHCFFSNIRRLIKKIIQDGITKKVISEKEIPESIWNVLYTSNTRINDKQRADVIVNGYLHSIKTMPWKIIDRVKKFIENKSPTTFNSLKEAFDDETRLECANNELQDKLRKLKDMGFDLIDYPVLDELNKQFDILNNINFPVKYPENEGERKKIINKVNNVLGTCQQIEQLAGRSASYGKTKKN